MENNSDNTWSTLMVAIVERHKRTNIDIALNKAVKRTRSRTCCCLCRESVDVWFERDDNKYCKSCLKLRFDKCEACEGCLDWLTLVRKDTFCSECYYIQNRTSRMRSY